MEYQVDYPVDQAGPPAHVIVPGREDVLTIAFVTAFAKIVLAMGLSRKEFSDWLFGTLFGAAERGVRIFDADGVELPIYADLEDRLYGEDSYARNTNVKRYATRPLKRRPQERLLEWYQYCWAAMRIDA